MSLPPKMSLYDVLSILLLNTETLFSLSMGMETLPNNGKTDSFKEKFLFLITQRLYLCKETRDTGQHGQQMMSLDGLSLETTTHELKDPQ